MKKIRTDYSSSDASYSVSLGVAMRPTRASGFARVWSFLIPKVVSSILILKRIPSGDIRMV
jgi:hypothetical protein